MSLLFFGALQWICVVPENDRRTDAVLGRLDSARFGAL